MGDTFSKIGRVALGVTTGGLSEVAIAASGMFDVDDPDASKTAKQLEAEANKVDEKKRLARVGDRETKGKTMYSQSMPGGGIPLKDELGV